MTAYDIITDQIIADIESGKAKGNDWVMPWHSVSGGMPINLASGKAYRGVNVLALWASAARGGFSASTWATFKQWQAVGASVRKGSKGTKIVFFKPIVVDTANVDDSGERLDETRMIAKAYTVFNADQVDGWKEPETDRTGDGVDAINAADDVINASGADIRHGGNRACYIPSIDAINMPERDSFVDTEHSSATENYYSTLFHELTHWSGADHRMNRKFSKRFGDSAYAFEELVAEFGAAFHCASLGITATPRADHAQYIDNWLRILKGDKRAIFTAASKAAQSVDYVHGLAHNASHNVASA